METPLERIRRWDNDSYAHFERWSAPHREFYVRSDKDAFDIAKLIIQSLLFIQAGALVIIPTSNSLREIGLADSRLLILLIILSIGAISTITAAICAFFALSNRSDYHWTLTKAYEKRARSRVMSDEFALTQDTRYAELANANDVSATAFEEEAKSFNQGYVRFRTWGIVAVLTSTALVIVASGVASYGLVGSHQTSTGHVAHFRIGLSWE